MDLTHDVDREALVVAATRLRDAGVDVLTLCFLNSFANPAHEREAAQHLRDALPDLPVSISSDVLHEFREYERATTTVMNAYVQPRMRGYLTSLGERMAERELRAAVSVVRSDGGGGHLCDTNVSDAGFLAIITGTPCARPPANVAKPNAPQNGALASTQLWSS